MSRSRERRPTEELPAPAAVPATELPGIEAQLAYATALIAGCAYMLYWLWEYTRDTGWDGVLMFLVANGAMVVLEITILGMGLFTFYRGQWMAVVLRRREGAAVVDDAEALDELSVGLFYRTFRFLHRGINVLILCLSLRLSMAVSPWVAWPSLVVLIVLGSAPILRVLAWVLFFAPAVGRASEGWAELLRRGRRAVGLWTLDQREPGPRTGRGLGLATGLLAGFLFSLGLELMGFAGLSTDKTLYRKGVDDIVVLTFHMGGVRPADLAETSLELDLQGQPRGGARPTWYRSGDNTWVAVLKVADLKPGRRPARLAFRGYTVKDDNAQGVISCDAATDFVVVE